MELGTILVGLGLDVSKVKSGAQDYKRASDSVQRESKQTQKESKSTEAQINKESKAFKGLNLNLVAVAAAAAGYLAVSRSLITTFARKESAILRTTALLRSQGNTIGFTAEEIHKYGQELADMIGQSEELIELSIDKLSAHANIFGENYKRSLRLAADAGALEIEVMDSAAERIGEVLSRIGVDPGVYAMLENFGVVISEQDQERLDNLAKQNKLYEAQEEILDRIEKRIGGAAKGQGAGTAGDIARLSNAWTRFQEALGERIVELGAFGEAVTVITDVLTWAAEALKLAGYNKEQQDAHTFRPRGQGIEGESTFETLKRWGSTLWQNEKEFRERDSAVHMTTIMDVAKDFRADQIIAMQNIEKMGRGNISEAGMENYRKAWETDWAKQWAQLLANPPTGWNQEELNVLEQNLWKYFDRQDRLNMIFGSQENIPLMSVGHEVIEKGGHSINPNMRWAPNWLNRSVNAIGAGSPMFDFLDDVNENNLRAGIRRSSNIWSAESIPPFSGFMGHPNTPKAGVGYQGEMFGPTREEADITLAQNRVNEILREQAEERQEQLEEELKKRQEAWEDAQRRIEESERESYERRQKNWEAFGMEHAGWLYEWSQNTTVAMGEMHKDIFRSQIDSLSQSIQHFGSKSKEAFEATKNLAKAQAIVNGIAAAVASFKYGAEIGGPPVGFLFAAISTAATTAELARINSQKYGGSRRMGGSTNRDTMYQVDHGPELVKDKTGIYLIGAEGSVEPAKRGMGANGMPQININPTVYVKGVETQTRTETTSEGINIMVDVVKSSIISDISQGGTPLAETFEGAYSLPRNT